MGDAPVSSQRPSRELLGTKVGPYKLERVLGEGAMGAVYRARDTNGRTVAVKVLLESATVKPGVRERFEREWSVMQGIEHPNVVRMIAHQEGRKGPLYYAMELLDGETLWDRLERDERLSIELSMQLFAQLAAGLRAVHAAGIIHRDVKPQNVFLCPRHDGGFTAKILDFGLARVVGSQITGSGLIVGTPAYIAPEQASGDTVDARVDVYALGLVMYRAITGQHPFSTDDQVATLGHQLLSPAPPLSWLDEEVPPALEALVLRMLRKRPESRPQSMDEVEDELAAIVRGDVQHEDRPSSPPDDRYGPLNPLAESLVKNALAKRGFR